MTLRRQDAKTLGIGFEDDGQVDTTRHGGRRGVDHRRGNTPGLIATQPGGVLDVDRPADAGIEKIYNYLLGANVRELFLPKPDRSLPAWISL
jgi:hypothetical protein